MQEVICTEQHTLEEIEQVKQVKARYFSLMDQKRWDEWNAVFTADVVAVYQGVPGKSKSEGLTELRCTDVQIWCQK